MIIDIVDTITKIYKNKNELHAKTIILKCDHCGKIYKRKYVHVLLKQKTHCCSSACSNKLETKKEMSKETCLVKFGTEFASKNKLIQSKIKEATIKKYGVEYPCLIPHVIETRNSKEAVYKQHIAKIKNGTYKRSHLEEDLFSSILVYKEAIKQKLIKKIFSIDIYVKDGDSMIQFDGVHWHFLDKPIDYIAKTKHEIHISKKFERDRLLDDYINNNKLRLIRITDVRYKENKDDSLKIILKLLEDKTWFGVKYIGKEFSKVEGYYKTDLSIII